ncbi:MAG TPA: DUF1611 domain-containing protein [Thermoanaerobaculia bacterium]|jgi:uncharacterized NAD-dependent epimerase/dehydratase family protein
MDGTAVVLCEGYFATNNGKTAHGLVRGSERYRILGVIDAPTAGRDAGEVLDGVRRGIPVFASLPEALARLPEKPAYAIVGLATSGGVFTPGLERALLEAVESGLSVVNGLHHLAADLPGLAEAARRKGVTITDVRRPKKAGELHFWTGEGLRLPTPRIAVLGTDCALGKRTTTRMLAQAARAAGIRAEWISTGQTGWLQGAPFGFVLDATPNDFVSGELEHAILSCAGALSPDLILIEGQSALRNPSGPCGSELLLSGGARGVILQHAPHRRYFEGLEDLGCALPPVADEIALIGRYGARTLGMALNGEGLEPDALRAERDRLERELRIPVALPLEEGVERLLPAVRGFLSAEAAA